VLLTLAATLLSALAGGTTSPKPPAPPVFDVATLPPGASVQNDGADGKPHPVQANLIVDGHAPQGDSTRVGLYLKQQQGWHTYWKSPGAIGQPTDIRWTLPDGVSVPDHKYPVPQRFDDQGMVSFGYEDQVLLLTELQVDASVAPGEYPIGADASWLVCLTSCIPGNAQLQGTLVVSAAGTEKSKGPALELFNHFAKQLPVPHEPRLDVKHALDRNAVGANKPFEVAFKITPKGGATFDPLPSEDAWPTFTPIAGSYDWMLVEDQPVSITRTEKGELLVVVRGESFEPEPLPTADRIGGLVQAKIDGKWIRTEIEVPLPWTTPEKVQPSSDPLWKEMPRKKASADKQEHGAVPAAVPGTPPEGGKPPPGGGAQDRMAVAGAAGGFTAVSLAMNLALAFVGGLILNIMPCVLPVLTLKLYSLVEQADIKPAEQRTAGLAYTAGIIASFWALAASVVIARSMLGMEVDWGFQFQYPPYVAALATIVFAFGLSLFGVFEIPTIGANSAGEAASKEGVVGYFFTGVFATLLATPCSAPFLGTAIAYAFSAPTPILFAIFTLVGLGLASPFLLIAFVPMAFKLLPRPGEWMDGFKQLLGFTLIATTVWLVDVLMAQIGADATTGFLIFLLAVGLGAWVFGRFGGVASTGVRQLTAAAAGFAIAGGVGMWALDLEIDDTPVCDDGSVVEGTALDFSEHIPWQAFSEERVDALAGSVVFIDFTADWCFTCKVNEKTILETAAMRVVMDELDVVPLKADWTRADPVITEWLRRNNRAGVPMYLILPKDPTQEPILLPEVITRSEVEAALRQAS